MKNTRRFSALRLALLPATAAVLMACASTPANNAALSEAQALYRQAAADADVARSAPLELRNAQAALKAGEDKAAVDHFAYLARQRAATAIKAGEIARAEQAVTLAGRDRERILMAARSSEAAEAVRASLTSRGIDSGRVTAAGMGEAKPVANNATAEGRQRNRRVEVGISNAS
jgi:hypothetical protein